ncbi:hypothetical protein CR161_07390 [Prosthecochloris sp. ZM]|uniref:nSTAND3 domain-containing NTPase n=1 Tax=Prosthecochloris sp. ZM TaxID=2283143 RepID=UPI000DF79C80|nr:PUA domain-containing protein [Prosthecochloris sp. ZM]RDD30551.1 hypothetical protein CR161_07390 [Prosthecochloris sp. ZM]
MIDIIDLKQEKQTSCRVMICQLDFSEFDWTNSHGLYFLIDNDKISIKIKEFLKIAKLHSTDLVIFPELSIPEKIIEKIQEWSKEQESIVICGSHYYKSEGVFISRCPVIVKGNVFFTEKVSPSPIEKSPIKGEGIKSGKKILKFINSFIGDFAVLICSDYLDENIKKELDLKSLDLLCVPSFQRDSQLYHNRMNIDCENSELGIYILYSNFKETNYGDGNSSLFGLMDKLFSEKLKAANYTDLIPDKKLFQFKNESEYLIADLNINNKRPFANRNISTEPNFHLISTNTQTKNKDLAFIQKVSHDDERYKRIDELYVFPVEYSDIINTLEKKNIVFIVGDPGIGKTYTAVKILKNYFENGYEPIWFAGLEKEERELQSKVLSDFVPSENQIVYFEDPFGRTAFERRDSLYQVFSPLLDKLSNLNCKIIITSRKEIFEIFSRESLLEKDVLQLKKELNIRNPSYDKKGLCLIFDKLASIICDWYENKQYRKLVYLAINNEKIRTPLAIRDLVFVSRNVNSKEVLIEHIERRGTETVKVFSLEILSSSITTKTILYITYFCGTKGKPYLSDLFLNVVKELKKLNLSIASFSLNVEMRSQIGYRIEQFGFVKSAYKFSHPVYEESLSSLMLSDLQCETIAKIIIQELAKKDIKTAYLIINKYVIKYPDVSLLLFKHMLEMNSQIEDNSLRLTLSQKLISTYYNTKNEDFFNLARHFYSLKDLVDDINNKFSDWNDLSQKLILCQRYINNSPLSYDSSLTDNIDWKKLLSNKNDNYFTQTKLLHLLQICVSINPTSLSIFIDKKGANLIKRTYILLDDSDRKRLFRLFRGYSVQKELRRYKNKIEDIKRTSNVSRFSLFRKVIFSELQFNGKMIIDKGAQRAISKPWVNLLPAGVLSVLGAFSAGSITGIYNENEDLIGVGVVEYSSEDLKKIIGHSSSQFQELIGYYHTSCAVKAEFLKRFRSQDEMKKWTYVEK